MLSVSRRTASAVAVCLPLSALGALGSAPGPAPDPLPDHVFAVARPSLSLTGARAALDAAADKARSLGAAPSIAVVDQGGHLVCFVRLDGSFPAGATVSIGKARTAATFRKPTSAFEDSINSGRTAMAGLEGITPLQGGVPIRIGDSFIGGIGVSGAASAAEDEVIANAGAAAFARASPPTR